MMPGTAWRLRGVNPATRANAEAAARRAGMSVEQWLDELVRNSDGSYPEPAYQGYGHYQPYPAAMPYAPPPPYFHGAPPPSQPNVDIDAMNSRLESLANRIDSLARQNTATAVPPNYPYMPEPYSGAQFGGAHPAMAYAPMPHQPSAPQASAHAGPSPQMSETLRGIVDLVDTSTKYTNSVLQSIQDKMNGRDQVTPPPVPEFAQPPQQTTNRAFKQPLSHEPEPEAEPTQQQDAPTRFMARRERRLRRMHGNLGEDIQVQSGAPCPPANPTAAPEPVMPAEPEYAPEQQLEPPQQPAPPPAPEPAENSAQMDSLISLAQSLQASLDQQNANRQSATSNVALLSDEIRSLSERVAAPGTSNDEAIAALQAQITQISQQFDSTAQGLNSLSDLDRKVSTLFEQIEQTRQTVLDSSHATAAQAAEQVAQHATQAAVQAAAEHLAKQLPPSASGNEAAIVQSLDTKLHELRAELGATDQRSQQMFEHVQASLSSIREQLEQNERAQTVSVPPPAPQAEPEPAPAPVAETAPPAEERYDEPPLDLGADQMVAAAPSEPVAQPGGPEPRIETETDPEASRPRAPGSGRPDVNESGQGPATQAPTAQSPAPEIPAQARDVPIEPGQAPVIQPVRETVQPRSSAGASSSLRSASSNEELLAAARRAARAASTAPNKRDTRQSSFRARLAEKAANRKERRAEAKEAKRAAKGAKAGSQEIPSKGDSKSSDSLARKPLVLAAAAILLFVGSIQIYGMLNKPGNRIPTAPVSASTTDEQPFSGGNQSLDASQSAPVLDEPGQVMPEAAMPGDESRLGSPDVRIVPSNGQENRLPVDRADVTGSLNDASASTPSTFDGAAMVLSTPGGITGEDATAQVSSNADAASAESENSEIPPTGNIPAALRRAAAGGDLVAQFEVASRLAEGRGTATDLPAAVAWYQLAAGKGLAPAQYRLGSMYEKGHGVESDTDTARLWYQRAAEQGNRKAMHNLAVLHANSNGKEPDFAQAAQWFRKAADFGLKDSQYNLGILYARGMGVPRNLAEAYKWLSIAADNGDTDAGQRRDTIANEIDEQTMVAARLAAQTWRPTPLAQSANVVELPPGGWGEETTAAVETPLPGSDIIKSTQKLLADIGLNPGPADGVWGPNTRRAITEFQEQKNLPATGTLTPELFRQLQRAVG